MSSAAPGKTTWLHRTFPWTRDPHAWRRRVAELSLFLCILVVIALARDASALVLFGLCALAVLVGAFVAEGWLGAFGPVLFYDMLRSARRGRFVWIRAVYAGFLLFLLFIAFMGGRYVGPGVSANQAESQLARNFFETFSVTQFIVLALLTPAYVAGAISEEKDRRTLEFLLATDLRNREIVLSKLGSRLANLFLIILVGLPLVSMLQFLGGVEPVLVQGSFAATALTVLGLAGVSILASTYFKKPRDAVALTYLFLVTYLVLSFLGYAAILTAPAWINAPVWFDGALTVRDLIGAFNSGNLGVYFEGIARAARSGTLDVVVPDMLFRYALFHVPVALVCTLWAVVRLRQVALAQMYGKAQRRSASSRLLGRPAVGNHPMLWKEVFAEGGVRLNWMSWIVVLVLLGATFTPFVLIVAYYLDNQYRVPMYRDGLAEAVNIWVRVATALVGTLALLSVAVRAATCYSSERDRQTLDSLLTTPLDSTPILLGKWLGAVMTVRLVWLWLALVWALGLMTGGLHPLALPLMVLAWFVFAAFFATLGLWFSVLSKTSLRATLWTLLTGGAVALGHWLPWLCCLALPVGPGNVEYLGLVQAGLTPPVVLGFLPFCGTEFTPGDGRRMIEMIGFSLFGVFAYGVATVLLWSGLTLRFRAITGREGFTRPERGWAPPRPRPRRAQLADDEPPIQLSDATGTPPAPLWPKGARLIEESWDEQQKKNPPDRP